MADQAPLAHILQYLTPPRDSFWRWSEDGEAIVWSDSGSTIAFRPELAGILERHRSVGLPPLGSVLLLLLAARDSWHDVQLHRRVRPPSKLLFPHEGPDWPAEFKRTMISPKEAANFLSEQLRTLNCLTELPREIRTKVAVRAELSAMILEDVPGRISQSLSVGVLDVLKHGVPLEYVHREVLDRPTVKRIWDDLAPLVPGLKRFDAEAFQLRFQTGVEAEVVPANEDEPLATRVRKLFGELEHDEEFAGLVTLAKGLLSMVTLPRPLVQPDEIPVGGVSDISNRGTLDKLLLSELAQDDEVLTLRVAMNEAMYLRRETPPRDPPRSRVVILDIGLRMWGTPRLMATAVALSFAAMNKDPVDLQVLIREGDHLFPTDLSKRDGLIEHLKCLDPGIHPGRALADLSQRLSATELDTDIILVTCPEVLADREFQDCVSEFGTAIEFLASVSRDGAFALMQRNTRGTKTLREAHFDVEKLLAPPRKPRLPLINPKASPDLPAILSLPEFPLRLSHNITPTQSWEVHLYGMLSITNDRRLMLWDTRGLGAVQITDRLHSRRLLWCATRAKDGVVPFVVGRSYPADLQLVLADLDNRSCDFFPLETGNHHVHAVCVHQGVLFVVHRTEVLAYSLTDATQTDAKPLPHGFRWQSGRYFQNGHKWFGLATHAGGIFFQEVPMSMSQTFAMFDAEHVDGPVGIAARDGNDFGLKLPTEYIPFPNLRPPVEILKISPCGKYVVVRSRNSQPSPSWIDSLIDVSQKTLKPIFGDPSHHLFLQWSDILPRHHRNRVIAIAAHPSDGLFLRLSHDRILDLNFDSKWNCFRMTTKTLPSYLKWINFAQIEGPPGVGYTLKKAEWREGSQAFLDSRGLLHLKCSDPKIPEATFVLYDRNMAGWASNGNLWGERYYTGRRTSVFPTLYLDDFAGRLR